MTRPLDSRDIPPASWVVVALRLAPGPLHGVRLPATFFSVKFFWEVFVTLFVVIDPPGTVPIFIGLTSGRAPKERNRLAWQAALVAFGVIVVFALFGQLILAYLGVQLAALEGAGGLLLLLVALQLLTGTAQEPTEAERQMANVAFVPLGTPLLAGPGAIVATMLFARRIHGAADAVNFNSWRICSRIVRATRVAVGKPALFLVTSR